MLRSPFFLLDSEYSEYYEYKMLIWYRNNAHNLVGYVQLTWDIEYWHSIVSFIDSDWHNNEWIRLYQRFLWGSPLFLCFVRHINVYCLWLQFSLWDISTYEWSLNTKQKAIKTKPADHQSSPFDTKNSFSKLFQINLLSLFCSIYSL